MSSVDNFPILVDVDGCLTDHNRLFLEEVNRRFGTSYTYEDITKFDYRKCLEPHHGEYILRELWQRSGLYCNHEPEPGALEAIEQLRKLRRVCAISAPLEGHIKSKYAWLLKHFEPADIFLVKDKSLVRGCLLVDDMPRNLEEFVGHAIVFDRPWNRQLKGVPRAMDWPDVVELAERFVP